MYRCLLESFTTILELRFQFSILRSTVCQFDLTTIASARLVSTLRPRAIIMADLSFRDVFSMVSSQVLL
jgi:hypothetical protein